MSAMCLCVARAAGAASGVANGRRWLRRKRLPNRLLLALDDGAQWIVKLYEGWGKPESALEWRQKAQIKPVDQVQR